MRQSSDTRTFYSNSSASSNPTANPSYILKRWIVTIAIVWASCPVLSSIHSHLITSGFLLTAARLGSPVGIKYRFELDGMTTGKVSMFYTAPGGRYLSKSAERISQNYLFRLYKGIQLWHLVQNPKAQKPAFAVLPQINLLNLKFPDAQTGTAMSIKDIVVAQTPDRQPEGASVN